MLTFLGAVVRVIAGFALACLAAGFVQVLFAVTPAELVVAGEERIGEAGTWVLLTATQTAVFAAPFGLIAAVISEWQGLRSFAYHAIVAMAIAVAGFGLIHATESATEASIVNSYAMAAYLTAGFVGGLVYWLVAGRNASRMTTAQVRMENNRRPEPEAAQQPAQNQPPRQQRPERQEQRPQQRADAPRQRQEAPPQKRPTNQADLAKKASSLADKLEDGGTPPLRPEQPKPPQQTENARMAQQRPAGAVPVTKPAPKPDGDPSTVPPRVPKPGGSA